MAVASLTSPSVILTLILFLLLAVSATRSIPSSLIEELNQPPPANFSAAVAATCARDPYIRYCSVADTDLVNIYKSTVVARHLCAESRNPDCNRSFSKIDLRSRPKAAPLYLSFAFFWSYCPSSVLYIDLANNSLRGAFPSPLFLCTQIQTLDLSHNLLSGEIPFSLFANLTNLTSLNLSYNDFSESNVEGLELLKRFNSSSFIHSGLLPADHSHGVEITATILLLIGVLASVLGVLGLVVWRIFRSSDRFSAVMLRKATDGFAESNLVRKGEREDVYFGKLRDGIQVEVRVRRGGAEEGARSGFVDECAVLVQLRNKNLVNVIGWCEERELLAVVVERMHVSTVEEWLVSSPPWKQRMKVLMGVVDGVCYLQHHWPQIGYDVKTRNVMLTQENEALISKLRVGNRDPESKKVHRLALFLLELIAKKRPGGSSEADELGFIEWVNMQFPDQIKKLIDEKMKLSSASLEQIKQITAIALEAADPSANALPTMSKVCRLLRKACAPPPAQTVHGKKTHHQRKHAASTSHKQRDSSMWKRRDCYQYSELNYF